MYVQVYIVSKFHVVKSLIPALVEGISVRGVEDGITTKPVDTLGVRDSDLTEADTDTGAGVTLLHPCTAAPSTASTTGERTSDTSTELEKNHFVQLKNSCILSVSEIPSVEIFQLKYRQSSLCAQT